MQCKCRLPVDSDSKLDTWNRQRWCEVEKQTAISKIWNYHWPTDRGKCWEMLLHLKTNLSLGEHPVLLHYKGDKAGDDMLSVFPLFYQFYFIIKSTLSHASENQKYGRDGIAITNVFLLIRFSNTWVFGEMNQKQLKNFILHSEEWITAN